MTPEEQAAFAESVEARKHIGSIKDWGPVCNRCGAEEYRIDGYCSIDCRDMHDVEVEMAEFIREIERLRAERDVLFKGDWAALNLRAERAEALAGELAARVRTYVLRGPIYVMGTNELLARYDEFSATSTTREEA